MIFRILGPLTLAPTNSPTFSLRTREARILGALLLQHNQTVPVGSLIDLLYERNPPATARVLAVGHVYAPRSRPRAWGRETGWLRSV